MVLDLKSVACMCFQPFCVFFVDPPHQTEQLPSYSWSLCDSKCVERTGERSRWWKEQMLQIIVLGSSLKVSEYMVLILKVLCA